MKSKVLENIVVESGGAPRRSLIYVPAATDLKTRFPLVLAFHGGDGRPEQMDRLTGFNQLADEEGFAVAYPEGINRRWNDGRQLDNESLYDDVSFIDSLLDRLDEFPLVDTDRVFAVGISNGGFFAQYLAIRGEERLNAIASVAAALPEEVYCNLVPLRPIPVLFILGTDDPVIPYDGGPVGIGRRRKGNAVSAAQTVEYWVRANGSSPREVTVELEKISDEDETRVVRSTWNASSGGEEVTLYRVEGGGHTWPGGWQFYRERYIGATSKQLNASRTIWEFFKSHLR